MWTELGHAQLEAGSVAEAIASYLKSGHTGRYADVIARSKDRGAHAELVKFLLMVRKKIKEPKVRDCHAPVASHKASAPVGLCLWLLAPHD